MVPGGMARFGNSVPSASRRHSRRISWSVMAFLLFDPQFETALQQPRVGEAGATRSPPSLEPAADPHQRGLRWHPWIAQPLHFAKRQKLLEPVLYFRRGAAERIERRRRAEQQVLERALDRCPEVSGDR